MLNFLKEDYTPTSHVYLILHLQSFKKHTGMQKEIVQQTIIKRLNLDPFHHFKKGPA